MSGAAFKKMLLAEGENAVCRALGGRHGRARVAVAYTADGDSAVVFTGSTEGKFLSEPRGEEGYGWDRAWLPEGYQRTLGEMAGNKAFTNMRYRPYVELGHVLRGRDFGGTFEAHVTVRAGTEQDVQRFLEVCDELAVKAVLIELPRGESQSQPMTASYHHGSLKQAIDEAHAIARRLASEGFDVTRVKLEAVGRNSDIPETDADAIAMPKNYFEYHIKVLLPPEYDTTALLAACQAREAHLSRNARKVRDDGVSERFITLRVFGLGRQSSEEKFADLVDAVRSLGIAMGQRIREYTAYDSNEAVDRGWLKPA
jgi:hypothetical protein